jgi:hypothetical protein
LGLARDFVANLYVCLKASPLNLLAGPPGYGQALMVGALARALGHGEAVLDITVRHSWDDDRQLLGVHDPAAGGFEPGPTGLAPRLLQAEADWGGERRGLYLILLQDFNVAPPEHYFAAFLNALGRPPGQRVVSLADPAADDPPYAIRLGPNVRFWGTVHADRATFPLSPRLLDQAGLIFPSPHDLAPHPHEPTQRKPVGGIAANGLIDRFVHEAEECPAGRWDILQPLLDLVVCASGDWGPGLDVSPRVQEAMRRYLANSVGVLAPARAADFVFQQRVVPILHGRGARFSARLETLAARAADSGLERTARHLYDALGRADAAGDVDLLNG